MIRKTLIFISMLLAAVQWLMAVDIGWYKYPLYRDFIDDVAVTSDKVYYVSSGSLFSFSPSDSESFCYDNLNLLSDVDVKNIYYNPEKKYLLVVYENSNIDIIFDSGKIVNMSDIKDSNVSSARGINHVAFGKDRIVVSTDFGFVIFSDKRCEVIESAVLNKKVNCMGIMGDYLLLFSKDIDWKIRMAPLDGRHNSIDKFDILVGFGVNYFSIVDNEHLAMVENNTNQLSFRKVDFNIPGWTSLTMPDKYITTNGLHTYTDGLYTFTDDKLIFLKKGGECEVIDLPEQLQKTKIGVYDTPYRLWSASSDGLGLYDVSSGEPTVLHDRMLYPGHITDKYVSVMKWSNDGERLYISNYEPTIARSFGDGDASLNYQTSNIIENGTPRDVSVQSLTHSHNMAIKNQDKMGNKRMYGAPGWMIESPDDPEKYYCANYLEGVYVVERNPQSGEYEAIGKYDLSNTPLDDNFAARVMYVDFDRDGNLWVGSNASEKLIILPAAKVKQDPKTITSGDWRICSKINKDYTSKEFFGLLCKKSDMVFYSMSVYEDGFMAVDTKGTWGNPDDDVAYHWNKLMDQDGNTVSYTYIMCFLEDRRGCVWVGTNAGVFEITNPSDATNFNMSIRRIKVPRNDGTNYADYLLSSEKINWMCEDPAGRKWIATDASGIYLVSETGDKILQHYYTDNSPLPSNMVCSIECDKTDNTVYVGTTSGLYKFKSDASAGKEDYSEIYAYPNPVRPEYSGMVNISGLVANSVVKITDTVGNVVYETRSEGGMASWDACGPDGNRVKSGVYYVYAAENNSGTSSTGAVTKILVIN